MMPSLRRGIQKYENKFRCKTEYLFTMRKESKRIRNFKKLRVFENMVLRRIFGPRRDEVTGELWKLWKSGGGSCFFLQGVQNDFIHFALQGITCMVSIFMFVPCINDD